MSFLLYCHRFFFFFLFFGLFTSSYRSILFYVMFSFLISFDMIPCSIELAIFSLYFWICSFVVALLHFIWGEGENGTFFCATLWLGLVQWDCYSMGWHCGRLLLHEIINITVWTNKSGECCWMWWEYCSIVKQYFCVG